jgi:hypothetical protein
VKAETFSCQTHAVVGFPFVLDPQDPRRGWVPLRGRHAVVGFCRGFPCGLVSTWVSLWPVGGFCHGWVSPWVGFAVGEFRRVTRVLNRVSVGFEADFGGSRGF